MKNNIRIFTLLFTFICFFVGTTANAHAAISYTYDANGNMLSDGSNCYEYNDANQVKKVRSCGNNQIIAEYVYDFNGNRLIKKTYSGGSLLSTAYSPSDSFETVKLASNGTTQNTSYYFANDQLLAKKNPDGTKYFFHNDHLGSASTLTNSSGTLVESTTYDPWGAIKTGGTKSKYLYTAQEYDSETGLDYYNARYYNTHVRRFTQPDSFTQNIYDPQDLNGYSYVKNNPVRYTDPTGHVLEDACIVECTALYISIVTTAPDTQMDMQNLAQDGAEFIANPTIGNGVAVGMSALSVAAPDASTGKSSRAVGQVVDKGINYYNNTSTFKRYEGKAGEGMHWGHFVEQNKNNIEKFGKQQIHNTLNVIRMPAKVNREMNKIYSSKPEGSKITVRAMMNKKSYIDQYKYAVKTYSTLINKYLKKK